jgi:hypothetical protein
MTPEEKAIELIDKFYFIEESQECDAWIDGYLAKKCALLAVDEIINSNPIVKIRFEKNNCSWIESKSNINYWQEVKQEIQKL